jgi:hypothetical protein
MTIDELSYIVGTRAAAKLLILRGEWQNDEFMVTDCMCESCQETARIWSEEDEENE